MAPDSFKNLGFGEDEQTLNAANATLSQQQQLSQAHDKPRNS